MAISLVQTLQTIDFPTIEAMYKQQRDNFPDSFRLRIHRSFSWINNAINHVSEDSKTLDISFISLWIGFNAAYAKDLEFATTADRAGFRDFLQTICQLDTDNKLYQLVWNTYPNNIRNLLDNQFVFQPFWDYHNGKLTEQDYLIQFSTAKKRAHAALASQDTATVLFTVFDRLYTLRNQLIHGGATCGSRANREQLREACVFLSICLAVFLEVMITNPSDQAWGKPFYPYLGR